MEDPSNHIALFTNHIYSRAILHQTGAILKVILPLQTRIRVISGYPLAPYLSDGANGDLRPRASLWPRKVNGPQAGAHRDNRTQASVIPVGKTNCTQASLIISVWPGKSNGAEAGVCETVASWQTVARRQEGQMAHFPRRKRKRQRQSTPTHYALPRGYKHRRKDPLKVW